MLETLAGAAVDAGALAVLGTSGFAVLPYALAGHGAISSARAALDGRNPLLASARALNLAAKLVALLLWQHILRREDWGVLAAVHTSVAVVTLALTYCVPVGAWLHRRSAPVKPAPPI